MVSRLATPASLVPRSTPTTMPFAAAPRSPPTSITAWMVPWITCAVACTSEVAMPPRPSIVFATVLLTALTMAPVTSPVPSMACTILSFTDSIKPTCCCCSIGHLPWTPITQQIRCQKSALELGRRKITVIQLLTARPRSNCAPDHVLTGATICPQLGTLWVRREARVSDDVRSPVHSFPLFISGIHPIGSGRPLGHLPKSLRRSLTARIPSQLIGNAVTIREADHVLRQTSVCDLFVAALGGNFCHGLDGARRATGSQTVRCRRGQKAAGAPRPGAFRSLGFHRCDDPRGIRQLRSGLSWTRGAESA